MDAHCTRLGHSILWKYKSHTGEAGGRGRHQYNFPPLLSCARMAGQFSVTVFFVIFFFISSSRMCRSAASSYLRVEGLVTAYHMILYVILYVMGITLWRSVIVELAQILVVLPKWRSYTIEHGLYMHVIIKDTETPCQSCTSRLLPVQSNQGHIPEPWRRNIVRDILKWSNTLQIKDRSGRVDHDTVAIRCRERKDKMKWHF